MVTLLGWASIQLWKFSSSLFLSTAAAEIQEEGEQFSSTVSNVLPTLLLLLITHLFPLVDPKLFKLGEKEHKEKIARHPSKLD